jgi:predicted RNase H-like HicB family nuclease
MMRVYFAVVFENPSGGLIVNFPDIPECVAFAETRESARVRAAVVLTDFLDCLEATGAPIPLPSLYEAIRLDPQNLGCEIILVSASANVAEGLRTARSIQR